MRHVSPTLRPFEGIERCEEVDMGGREAGVLSHAAVRRLRRAREEGTPLVLRAGLAREQIEAMRGDWEGLVRGTMRCSALIKGCCPMWRWSAAGELRFRCMQGVSSG